jgi:hypothetical protein
MGMMASSEVVAYLQRIEGDLVAEQARLTRALGEHPTALASTSQQAETAWAHLLEMVVPSLEARVLDGAAARLSLPAVGSKPVAERRVGREKQLREVLASIEGVPRYQKRESLLNETEIRLPGLRETLAPLRDSVAQMQGEPVFDELIRENYGTPEYARKWYQPTYYRHWKAADRILDKHRPRTGARDFAALRARYLEEKRALATLEEEAKELLERSDAIQTMVKRHGEAETGLQRLDDWVLQQTRALVREHLGALASEDIGPLVANDPGLLLATKRVLGAQAKQGYLDAVAGEWLTKPLQDVQHRLDKVRRGIEKYRRPSHGLDRVNQAEIEAKYGLPIAKWQERWDRYQNTTQQIIVYDNYSTVNLVTSYLWWDMMTGGRVHGDFIPEVAQYHHHHAVSHAQSYTSSRDDMASTDAS